MRQTPPRTAWPTPRATDRTPRPASQRHDVINGQSEQYWKGARDLLQRVKPPPVSRSFALSRPLIVSLSLAFCLSLSPTHRVFAKLHAQHFRRQFCVSREHPTVQTCDKSLWLRVLLFCFSAWCPTICFRLVVRLNFQRRPLACRFFSACPDTASRV